MSRLFLLLLGYRREAVSQKSSEEGSFEHRCAWQRSC